MSHKKRGYALIFNNMKFNQRAFAYREGSDVDAAKLGNALTNLHFQVNCCTDLTAKEIKDKVEEFANMRHDDMDCVLITILSHGLEKGKILAKDTTYKLDELTYLFQPDRCPSLAGKPKLFFVNACRGDQNNAGVFLNRSLIVLETDSLDESAGYTIPLFADFLIAYSTVEGHVSLRNIENGTWFIQSLCSELIRYGKDEHLLDILTFVNQRVATEFESKNKSKERVKQVPCFMSSLTRKLYFKDKPFSA